MTPADRPPTTGMTQVHLWGADVTVTTISPFENDGRIAILIDTNDHFKELVVSLNGTQIFQKKVPF